MNEPEMILRAVIDRKGHKYQTYVAIEELSELQKELTKQLRGKGNHQHLIEEFTDVIICMSEIEQMYNLKQDELNAMYDAKIQRLKERLEHDCID